MPLEGLQETDRVSCFFYILQEYEEERPVITILGFPGKRFPGSREICKENYLISSPNLLVFLRKIILSLAEYTYYFYLFLWNMYCRIKTLNDNITTNIHTKS